MNQSNQYYFFLYTCVAATITASVAVKITNKQDDDMTNKIIVQCPRVVVGTTTNNDYDDERLRLVTARCASDDIALPRLYRAAKLHSSASQLCRQASASKVSATNILAAEHGDDTTSRYWESDDDDDDHM